GLQHVADRRRSPMSIHIVHLLGLQSRIIHRVHHHAISAFAFLSRLRDVVSIRTHTVPDDLSQYLRAARLGVFQFFENENPRALADHKPVAVFVPWTAGL